MFGRHLVGDVLGRRELRDATTFSLMNIDGGIAALLEAHGDSIALLSRSGRRMRTRVSG